MKIRALLCLMAGVLLYLLAEAVDTTDASVENGRLFRNPCGKGEQIYSFSVDGFSDGTELPVVIAVPEQQMTEEEFLMRVPEMVEVLCETILGENSSLYEVRHDLNLVQELPEFGVKVTWDSSDPEVISTLGVVEAEEETGTWVNLQALLEHGEFAEMVEISVAVYPPAETMEDRFLGMIEELVHAGPENVEIILPTEFEGQTLTYRTAAGTQNWILPVLGMVAAICMLLKEKSDQKARKKQRDTRLMEDYPDLVSEFLILIGAGYPAKAAWRKLELHYRKEEHRELHPLYEEMQVAVHQMETGMPETRVYAEFGRRCQLRCYVKFASLLESSVNMGGKQLRKLLEAEMEEAFRQRMDQAKRKGEELSSKLLLPMFGMLCVVMVMVVAPAFLSVM